jgi:hypothetical protein
VLLNLTSAQFSQITAEFLGKLKNKDRPISKTKLFNTDRVG